MTPSTFNLAVPEQGAKRRVTPAVVEYKFGDGYVQNTADGINNQMETWDLQFNSRPRSVIQAIADYLADKGGVTQFAWTTPRGETKQFICKSWDETYNHDADCSLSCTFTQVPWK